MTARKKQVTCISECKFSEALFHARCAGIDPGSRDNPRLWHLWRRPSIVYVSVDFRRRTSQLQPKSDGPCCGAWPKRLARACPTSRCENKKGIDPLARPIFVSAACASHRGQLGETKLHGAVHRRGGAPGCEARLDRLASCCIGVATRPCRGLPALPAPRRYWRSASEGKPLSFPFFTGASNRRIIVHVVMFTGVQASISSTVHLRGRRPAILKLTRSVASAVQPHRPALIWVRHERCGIQHLQRSLRPPCKPRHPYPTEPPGDLGGHRIRKRPDGCLRSGTCLLRHGFIPALWLFIRQHQKLREFPIH
jgi:hypothetical protein